jgi:hypothetical protein
LYFLLWRVAGAQDGDGYEAGVRLASTNNDFIIKKEGTGVTHGTSVALTNMGRKLTNRQMPY